MALVLKYKTAMKKNGLRFAFAIFSVYILVACQQNQAQRHGDATFVTSADGGFSSGTGQNGMPRFGGTSDQAGGGNQVNGKPIEFYKTDITDASLWPEYQKYIAPIDQSITAALGTGAEMLVTASRRKTWYRLPIEFDQLSKEAIGTSFASFQAALQTNREVFLSDPEKKDQLKSGMSEDPEERAKLLLHELVMTWYLVKYEDMSYYCAAYGETEAARECKTALTMNKGNKIIAPASRKEFLTPDEYESIRHVTQWLWSNHVGLTRQKLYEKLIEKNFDPRMYNATSFENRNLPSEIISKDALVETLLAQQNTNRLPRFCGFNSQTQVSSEAECNVKFTKISDKLLRLSIEVMSATKESTSDSIDFELSDYSYDTALAVPPGTYVLDKQVFRNGMVFHSFVLREPDTKTKTAGDIERKAVLLFSKSGPYSFQLEGIMLQKWSLQKYKGPPLQPGMNLSLVSEPVRLTGVDETMRFIFNVQNPPIFPDEIE